MVGASRMGGTRSSSALEVNEQDESSPAPSPLLGQPHTLTILAPHPHDPSHKADVDHIRQSQDLNAQESMIEAVVETAPAPTSTVGARGEALRVSLTSSSAAQQTHHTRQSVLVSYRGIRARRAVEHKLRAERYLAI